MTGVTTGATADFFSELGRRGHDPRLEKVTGTMRFDLQDGEKTDHYLVAVKNGDIAVSDEILDADVVFRADSAMFDEITSGETNAFVALLRGEIAFEGDAGMLVFLQRLLPGRSNSHDQRRTAEGERRQQ